RALSERGRRCAFYDDLHVVQRDVRLARVVAAARLGRMMRGDVPPAYRQVDAAAIGDLVVDDDELLVVRGARGQVTVEHDVDAIRKARHAEPAGKQLAVHG